MKKITLKCEYALGVCALMVAEFAADYCGFIFFQTEIHDSVKMIRKLQQSR